MKDLVISIRNYNKDNYKEIINNIKKAGFKNVFIEWYNDNLELQEDILNYVKESELNILFAHLGYQDNNVLWEDSEEGNIRLESFINDIKICKEKGLELVIIHPTTKYVNPGMTQIGLNRINKLLDVSENLNVKVAFENIELVEYLEFIIKKINRKNLGICFDVGHCNLFSNSKINTELFKNKVYAIHLHDNYKELDDHNLPFDGTVDWETSINQIIDMNYNGELIIESGYNKYYKDLSLEEYYKLAYKRGLEIKELFELHKRKK